MDPNNQPMQPPLPQDQGTPDLGAGAFPQPPATPVDPAVQMPPPPMPAQAPPDYAAAPAPAPQPQSEAFPPSPAGMPAMSTDPNLAPPAPLGQTDPSVQAAPAGMPAPTDPSLNNEGLAVPPAMAGSPEMAGTTSTPGGRKALGFVFVIGGVIALIVLIVIALRML